jgi:hypothetical protein
MPSGLSKPPRKFTLAKVVAVVKDVVVVVVMVVAVAVVTVVVSVVATDLAARPQQSEVIRL